MTTAGLPLEGSGRLVGGSSKRRDSWSESGSGRPKGRACCLCCGLPAVTTTEERILVALYTAPRLASVYEVAMVARTSARTVKRAAIELPNFIVRTKAKTTTGTRRSLYCLSSTGIAAVRTLSAGQPEAAE